ASLADRSSAVDVEQILGRVLRLPYVRAHQHELLNMSYVLTASTKFQATLEGIVKGLQQSGFSEHDYRAEDLSAAPTTSASTAAELDFDEIDTTRVSYDPEGGT